MNNATDSEARLESILAQVRVLKAKYNERAEVTGENFNVFSILDRESDEVKTHSAIIAELLNPQGSHSQGILFLKLFLKKLQKGQMAQKEQEELREKLKQIEKDNEYDKFEVGVEVSFEKKGQRSRIDILIESSDVCIVIENKIYAEDQKRQLGRYYEYALDTGKKRGIIYLTLGGDEPEERTLYGDGPDKIPLCRRLPEDTVVCLSYEKFIDEWLGACIKEVARIPQIRETLHQYQMTVKKLTGQPINKRYAMTLKNILLEGRNYNLISDLESAISEAKFDLKCKFWSELENQLKAREDLNEKVKNLRYEVHDNKLGIKKGREETEMCIRNHLRGKSPGLTFSFFENKNHEIMFRIAHDADGHHYGFVLCEKGGHKKVAIDDTEHEEYLTKYKIGNVIKKDGWGDGWLTYKYFENPEIDFTDCKSIEEYETRNQELVEKRINEICDVIKKISE